MENKKKSKIKSIILAVVYLLLVGFLLTYIGFEVLMPDKTAKYMQFKVTNVISPSMEPKMKRYDAIVITNYKKENLKVGDIITFKQKLPIDNAQTDGERLKYVTHRITDIVITEEGLYTFKTKGDKNFVVDDWTVNENNIIGKYLFKIPKGGFVILFLQSWIGLLIIAFNIGIIFVIVYLLKKQDETDEEKIRNQIEELQKKLKNSSEDK